MRPEEEREALVRARLLPPREQALDEPSLVGRVVGRVAGEQHERLLRVEVVAPQKLRVSLPGPAAMVDVGLRPAGDRDPRRIDAVVANEVRAHDLVLHDVEVEVRRDDALAHRVVPGRDVADDRHAQPARRHEVRHRDVSLEVRHDEAIAVGTHGVEQRRGHVPPAGEEPGRHRAVDDVPARQVPRAVDVEERDGVAVRPPLAVEAVPEARAHGERVEADVIVEEDVGAPHDAWPERHLHRHQLGRLDHFQPVELVAPGIDVLRVQREQRRDALVEGVAQAGDDAAVEEDAVGQRIHECDPQPSRPRFPSARPVDCHDGR